MFNLRPWLCQNTSTAIFETYFSCHKDIWIAAAYLICTFSLLINDAILLLNCAVLVHYIRFVSREYLMLVCAMALKSPLLLNVVSKSFMRGKKLLEDEQMMANLFYQLKAIFSY